jgi:hypothetical protein
VDGIHPIQEHISLYTQTLVQFGWDSKVYKGWGIRFDSWQRYFSPDFTYTPVPVSIYNPAHPTPLKAGVKSEWSTQHIATPCSGHSNKCFVTAQYVTSTVITTVKSTAYLYVNRTTYFQNFKNSGEASFRSPQPPTQSSYYKYSSPSPWHEPADGAIVQAIARLFSGRWLGLDPKPLHVGFVLNKLPIRQGFLRVVLFSPTPISLHKCSIHTLICYRRYAMLTTDSDTK